MDTLGKRIDIFFDNFVAGLDCRVPDKHNRVLEAYDWTLNYTSGQVAFTYDFYVTEGEGRDIYDALVRKANNLVGKILVKRVSMWAHTAIAYSYLMRVEMWCDLQFLNEFKIKWQGPFVETERERLIREWEE
jgi:hypothetical protein